MLRFITDLGDTAYLLPASLLILGYLVFLRARSSAVAWTCTILACAGLTVVLKIVFMTCGEQLPGLRVYSPSGHTSIATTFYLGVGLLVSRDRTTGTAAVTMALAVGL